MKIQYTPIGVMHCEIRDPAEAPRFYTISDIGGVIEVYDEYAPGLQGLEQNDHIMVVFHFHLSEGQDLLQRRRGNGELQGVFNLCSPRRPNSIGVSVLQLEKIEGTNLFVKNVDLVDNTPILDIKPYKSPGIDTV